MSGSDAVNAALQGLLSRQSVGAKHLQEPGPSDDQMQRMNDKVNFTKNLALIGGAAFAAATRDRWPWRLAS